jgi:hypothetical protein
MNKQQVRAFYWVSLLAGGFLSVAIPVLMVSVHVESELAFWVFAPGVGVMSPVHNILPALIVTLVVDALLYCIVAFITARLLVRLIHSRQHR